MRIPTEDFTDVSLASEDIDDHYYQDDHEGHDYHGNHDNHDDYDDHDDIDDHEDHEEHDDHGGLASDETLSCDKISYSIKGFLLTKAYQWWKVIKW